MAPTIISKANDATPAIGGLFEGLSFFLLQRLPMRSIYVQRIQANGGRVVKTEAQADHVIADHVRRDCPPGSVSYTFIDSAINASEIPDPADHIAGAPAGAVREVGSTSIPGKRTRTSFTPEDDRVLWQWVERAKSEGGMVKGNDIYKQLEAKNSRHTFQAWRDRFIKRLMDKPPAGVEVTVPANAPPSPPDAPDEQEVVAEGSTAAKKRKREAASKAAVEEDGDIEEKSEPGYGPDFSKEDFDNLMLTAGDILKIDSGRQDDAWEAWAVAFPGHTADEWRGFWEETVMPAYLQSEEYKKAERRKKRREHSLSSQQDNRRKGKQPTQPATIKEETDIPASQRLKRKRHREEDFTDLFSQEYEEEKPAPPPPQPPKRQVNPTDPIQIPSDSDEQVEMPEDAMEVDGFQVADEDEDAESYPTTEDRPLETSEANQYAEQQLLEERDAANQDPEELADDGSVLLTSEANQAAEQQIRRESGSLYPTEPPILDDRLTSDLDHGAGVELRREEATGASNANDVTISSHLIEDGEVEDGLPGEEVLALEDDLAPGPIERETSVVGIDEPAEQRPSPAPATGSVTMERPPDADEQLSLSGEGHPLTEANLASQQAEHRPPVLRGTDLPEDDQDKDQTDFLSYLQDIMSKKQRSQSVPAQPKITHSPTKPPDAPGLPLSSQQDVEDVLDANLDWPSSPQQSKRSKPTQQITDESEQFETQIAYPRLPSQEEFEQADEDMFTTQPPEPKVVYPALPRQLEQLEDGLQSQPDVDSQAEGQEDGFIIVEHDDVRKIANDMDEDGDEDDGVEEEDDLDLAVPEPPDGFDFPSSPIKPAASQLSQRLAKLASPRKRQGFSVEEAAAISPPPAAADPEDAIAISSAESSSTPYESSRTDEKEQAREARQPDDFEEPEGFGGLETQDILNAGTQQPDFRMPLPPDSDSDEEREDLRPTPLNYPSQRPRSITPVEQPSKRQPTQQSQSQSIDLAETQKLENDDIDTYIDALALRLSVPETKIIDALKATSTRPQLAELVLLDGKAGKGLPRIPGVWTEEEDQAIEGGDAGKMNDVAMKHGWEELFRRLEWLDDWRVG